MGEADERSLRWLRDVISESGLGVIEDRLVALTEPTFAVAATLDRQPGPKDSRLGGLPVLPDELAWPSTGNGVLTFVGQLNLNEFAASRVDLPATGLLSFFIGVVEGLSNVEHAVFYLPELSAMRVRNPPEGARFAGTPNLPWPTEYQQVAVDIRPSVSLPADLQERFAYVDEEAIWGLLDQIEERHRGCSRLRGYPYTLGSDACTEAFLVERDQEDLIYASTEADSLGREIERSVADGYHDLAERQREELAVIREHVRYLAEHATEIEAWQLLIDINSHDEAGMMWVDAGFLQYMISMHDGPDFSRTYARIECS